MARHYSCSALCDESRSMTRNARLVVPGLPHHLTHRGNRREEIFKRLEDYRVYMRMLRKFLVEVKVRLWAYTLMPNHVHLITVPCHADSLSKLIHNVHGGYADFFNGLYGTVGHLWQGRFFSSVMDEGYLWNAVRYVERNPVRAGLVSRAEDYEWSSAAAHCGLRDDPLLSNDMPLSPFITNWSEWLATGDPEDLNSQIRQNTALGRPCGSEFFIRGLEHDLGRSILPRKRGPKPKKTPSTDSDHGQLNFDN